MAVMNKHPNVEITEGVFANALRTMTIAGKCQNMDRGVYSIGVSEKKELTKYTNGQQGMPYLKLKKEVLRMARDIRNNFSDMVKDVNMSVDDVELLQYILRVRSAIDKFENEVGN